MALLARVGAGIGLGLGLGAGAGAAGIGWFYSSLLLDTSERPQYPERVLTADGATGHPGGHAADGAAGDVGSAVERSRRAP